VIGNELGVAPRTARRLYDELKGAGAHHGLLEGKGGRRPVAKPAAKKTTAKKPAAAKKAA
jgi:DNA-binding transcriptional regulator YhcF (GntR family)